MFRIGDTVGMRANITAVTNVLTKCKRNKIQNKIAIIYGRHTSSIDVNLGFVAK